MEYLEEEDSINKINIAPLVDVCLVLVLVFMVTLPFSILYGITVKENKLSKYGLTTPQEHVVVHLTDRGIFIQDEKGKEQPIPYEDFGVVVRQMLQVSATKSLLLKVDRDVPHGQTVWSLDIAKQNGAREISIFEG